MREYNTARSIIGFFEFIAWIIVIAGVIAFLGGLAAGGATTRSLFGGGSSLGAVAGAIPGIVIVFFGLFGVVLCQTGRAGVDTAEMTGKMLVNSNEQLRLMKARALGKNVVAGPTKEVLNLPRFDAAPLIAFIAPKETDYGTETDGRISQRRSAYRADQWADAQAGG